jgi:hypothetical protein
MVEIGILELEKRMRPGALSVGGFLGQNGSLEAILRLDAEVLTLLGVTHGRVAGTLERVIRSGLETEARLYKFRAGQKSVAGAEPHVELFRLAHSEATVDKPVQSAGACPDPLNSRGERCGFPFEHVWFSRISWCGYQACPWDCKICQWSDLDFRIENQRTGETLTGPGLIVHLIREHHFFEGLKSPYRVDPIKLVKVLELRNL